MMGVGRVVLVVALAAAMPASVANALRVPSAESRALDTIYYSALLSGRDPDAAVRKARFSLHILTHDLGMTPAAALADVTRFMLWRGRSLCGG